MTKAKTGWLLLGILCLTSFAVAQDAAWQKYFKAGTEAYQQGQYAEAEEQLVAALEEAEKFGEQDPSLAFSLNALGLVYRDQGQNAKAEPLYRRSLVIREKALGPEHPDVAQSLENYAALLRKLKPIRSLLPWSEVAKMEARAKAIRSKHAEKNPRR